LLIKNALTVYEDPTIDPDACNKLLEKLLNLRGPVFLGYSLLIKGEKKKTKYIIN